MGRSSGASTAKPWLWLVTRTVPLTGSSASTGAAAALIAATRRPALVHAVVSRGGRPDLAGPDLRAVKAPTLLIVGGGDPVVLQLNQRAYGDLLCERRLEIIAGATHLFPEPGALEQVARLAGTWFRDHLIQ